MSYFEDRWGGYVGREEYQPPPQPTFKQMRMLERLADAKKLTEAQREALKALIRWSRL